jgi:hypothetical protein
MPIIGTVGTGSTTESNKWTDLNELLVQLPDNTNNLIDPKDIRDSVYTLWERVDEVSLIASSAASASAFFQNTDPVPVTIGGISAGTTFPTPTTMQDMWNQLLYPYIPPSVSITGGDIREFGSSNAVTLNWTVTKNSEDIQSIIVNGIPQAGSPFTTNQSGFQNTFATQDVNTTFSITSNDGTQMVSDNTTVTWRSKRYWGTVDLSSLSNPNLTTSTASVSSIIPLLNDSVIIGLDGAGVGSGNELSTGINKTYTSIDGGGDYLVFAWPSSFSNSQTPQFIVNGLPNTAFTRIRNNSPFVNQWGYTTNYEVWISNTLQNSPLNIIIS